MDGFPIHAIVQVVSGVPDLSGCEADTHGKTLIPDILVYCVDLLSHNPNYSV